MTKEATQKPLKIQMTLELAKKTELTKDNYYSPETDLKFMSATWFKNFEKCEAAALQQLSGNWHDEEDKTALLVGNFVHSYFESKESHEQFIEENKWDIFTKKKATKADIDAGNVNKKGQTITKDYLSAFEHANVMIDRLERTNEFNFFYNNENCIKESIVTGNLFGVPWKAKIDSLNVEKGYFCDLKTTAEMHRTFYNPETHKYDRLWFDEYNYGLQMAAYKKLLQEKYHKPFQCFIFAVDKKKVPQVEAIQVDNDRFEKGIEEIELYQPRLMDVLNGNETPVRCEHCDYCKQTYQPFGFKTIEEVVANKY